MKTSPIARALASLLASFALACSSRGEPSAPVTEPPPPAPTAAPVAITPKRTVEVRNPFGNTQIADNLMADGDFELTGRYDQQPWLAFGASGQSVLNFETGGKCRSGVRCLVLKPGDTVIGWFATPKQGKITLSLWARPIGGNCKDLTVRVVDIDDEQNAAAIPAPGAVDETGQCHFESAVAGYPGGAPAVWLEVADRAKVTSITVDEVVALPLPTNAAQLMSFRPGERAEPPAKLASVAAWWHAHRRFGLPPVTGPERPQKTPAMERRER